MGGVRTGRWGEPLTEPVDFFDLKGCLEEIFERTGVGVEFRSDDEYGLLRGSTAGVYAGDERVGVIGQVHPRVASRFAIEGGAYLFEVDVGRLVPFVGQSVRHRPLSRFPEVTQDIAVLVEASVSAAKVRQLIESTALVTQARLFDVYEGAPLPEGKRSFAFAVHFQSPDKTLTDADVADARRRIVRRLEHELGAELRGG
jgi:phenylalanyl-tRNA synthetase beta chain